MSTIRIETRIIHQPAKTANRLEVGDWVVEDTRVMQVDSAEFTEHKQIRIHFNLFDSFDGGTESRVMFTVDRERLFRVVAVRSHRTIQEG